MKRIALALLVLLPSGCATLVRNAGDRFADNLSAAVLDSNDPATIRDALPAYLLLLDSMVASPPAGEQADPSQLRAAARMNAAYASNFTGVDRARAKLLSRKAFDYARRASCASDPALCAVLEAGPEEFARKAAVSGDIEGAYVLGTTWAALLQANSDDAGMLADLPKVEALLERVVTMQPGYDHGQAQLYLGVLNSLRPEAAGGKPEKGRAHFEKAIELSAGRNLMAKVLFAEFYSRLVFNQSLHDRLLGEVLAADPIAPGFTLTNTLAQSRARQLLESGKEYF